MKRYVCTVAVGMLLALAGAGTAAAGLEPPTTGDTQEGTQSTLFGDQTIGEQRNDADVTQAQGNGNINVAPAISVFGDASTWNSQGSGNTAAAVVDQSNTASQSQSTGQEQNLTQDGSGGSCCTSSEQSGEQKVYGGDQTIGEQKNDADVGQYQGNGNINVAPAVSVFGDASTRNSQGNGNTAVAVVDQSNSATQSQRTSQTQSLDQSGGSCCDGQSQAGEQKIGFGDQTIDKQRNEADVTQKQGNGNVNISPAISVFGDASTWNAQGNGNTAIAVVDQSNSATQSQSASQTQDLAQNGDCCERPDGCKDHYGCKPKDGYEKSGWYGKEERCCDGSSQTGEQKTFFGDQYVGKQENDADVYQAQGNHNLNVAPAISIPKRHKGKSCGKEHYGKCGGDGHYVPDGGYASTWNSQGNGNTAVAYVGQSNDARQSQWASQTQTLVQGCCEEVNAD
jgi:hypothetical protein